MILGSRVKRLLQPEVVVVVMCCVHVQCYLCLSPSRYNAHLCGCFTESRCRSILCTLLHNDCILRCRNTAVNG